MESLSHSKYYVTNRYARIILGGYEEILGRDRLTQALSHAGLDSLLTGYPPNDLDEVLILRPSLPWIWPWKRYMAGGAGAVWEFGQGERQYPSC